MNFPTIAIIFPLFFCAAWAGTSTSRPRKAQSGNPAWSKAQSGNTSWSKDRDPSSARFPDDVAAGIAYMNETNEENFTKFRDTAGTSGGGGEMHKIDALSKAWNTKPPANEDAMNSVWAAGLWADNKTKSSSKVSTQKWQPQGENSQKAEWSTQTKKRRNGTQK
ncbi:hypothetical protein GPALN_003447 [Globodera pallida]|nr:hypothetical protein GPALN_003447 [Globodera pallida]